MSGPLTAAYGPETKTLYSDSGINRLGFLRTETEFLQAALHHPTARFLALNGGLPLVADTSDSRQELHFVEYASIGELIGEPYKSFEELAKDLEEGKGTNYTTVQVVFLGLDETKPGFAYRGFNGAPLFAVDTTVRSYTSKPLAAKLEKFNESVATDTVSFRGVMFGVRLPRPSYGLFAEAAMIIDWNARNRFCGSCGKPTLSREAGFKRQCSPTTDNSCDTYQRLSNLCFPRTDSSIIVAVMSYDGERVLIGRSKRFPKKMYSCLAGFLEPGESLEDCVRREVFEESGVKVGRVFLHSSQPWPYPANIMIGCLAEVCDSSPESHEINLGHDPELEDAKWVPIKELRAVVHGKNDDADFFIPPSSAIAWTLLDAATKRLEKL
ncbi:Peroxisomal NADH pyrophosphatase NUDT12 [Wickerhamiella sorbophila]|uniref:NAD(+) diphosphatase n=1 Tax=Wickerhamiella sorbophila TaxID=45607 RepID=A0A2T0FLC4_9ASCO|nr:Peroxisomal NADH pyrophosphatase NUDT12 [Wickerhamiella sorbophila]PRT55791.1 Peroxisomal NADH pyrophosphatase NUDT12 [Wickerhamiella sorbophila]